MYIKFQALKRECGHLALQNVTVYRYSEKFQALKRECGHLACCAGSVAWGAGKGKLFREAGILGDYSREF